MAPKLFILKMAPREHGNADKHFLYAFEAGKMKQQAIKIELPQREIGYFCREKAWQVVPKHQATALSHHEANLLVGRMKRLGYVATVEKINLDEEARVLAQAFCADLKVDLTNARRIGWLDSVDMPSHIHLTLDGGQTTICGHKPLTQKAWKITSDIPRKDHGRSNYCSQCFAQGNKSVPFLESRDVFEGVLKADGTLS